VPRVDEAAGRDGRAVGEGPPLLQGHRVVLVVLGLDGLGDLVDGGAVGLVAHQAGEEEVDDLPAPHLVRRGRDEWVLRLRAVDRDDAAARLAVPAPGAVTAVVTAAAGDERE